MTKDEMRYIFGFKNDKELDDELKARNESLEYDDYVDVAKRWIASSDVASADVWRREYWKLDDRYHKLKNDLDSIRNEVAWTMNEYNKKMTDIVWRRNDEV